MAVGAGISDGEGDQKPVVNVGWYDAGGIGLHVTLAGLTLENTAIDSTEFVTVSLPESPLAGQLGEPCLPVIRRLVAVPRDAEVEILVAEGSATILDLEALGYPGRLVPIQGPQSIDRAALAQLADEGQAPESLLHLLSKPLHYDKQAYDSVEFLPVEPVTLTPIGFSRDLQIQLLEIRPVAYNPASGELAVWPTIDVELRFTGDFKSPTNPRLGAGLDSVVLNPPTSTSRGGSGNYLIITAEDFAASAPLAQFVSAKTAQGFTVTSHTMVVGTYRSDVKAYIDSLWGTPDAPDYILIVGDAIYDRSNVTSNLIPTWLGGGSDLSLHGQSRTLAWTAETTGCRTFRWAVSRFAQWTTYRTWLTRLCTWNRATTPIRASPRERLSSPRRTRMPKALSVAMRSSRLIWTPPVWNRHACMFRKAPTLRISATPSTPVVLWRRTSVTPTVRKPGARRTLILKMWMP